MTIVLWIVNGLLAVLFLMAGATKVIKSKPALAEMDMGWVEEFSDSQVKSIGALEVLAAIGLILPLLLKIAPVLTPIAALGLVLVMVGAIRLHQRRNEPIVMQVVLAALAVLSAVLGFLVVAG